MRPYIVSPSSVIFCGLQITLWAFVGWAWVQVIAKSVSSLTVRQWFARGSLGCASCTLLLTTILTIYCWSIQKHPYDRLEGKYLFYISTISLLGVLLGMAGKSRPRLVGLVTSIFTFLVALADAITM